MTKPFIQLGNVVREMTDEEHQELLDNGWTMEPNDEISSPHSTRNPD